MPFEIVRNDIVNMTVDAIVNTANPRPIVGYGVDYAVHKKAGPELLAARKAIGDIAVGDVAVTPGYELNARLVIHAVGPVWQDGSYGEEKLLRQCYDKALQAALDNKCESIAFPLLATGNYGFPKPLALQTAINAFSSFLLKHEIHIYLVVFTHEAFELSEKLFRSVESYIDENYVLDKTLNEYGLEDRRDLRRAELEQLCRMRNLRRSQRAEKEARIAEDICFSAAAGAVASAVPGNLDDLLKQADAGFSETLLKLIDKTGKKDSDIYKRANVDRKLFSKIRNNPEYRPSKATALAFALALELDLDKTKDFIGRAGYALTHSSKFDIIVEYFIKQRNYDVFELNEVLFYYDQPLIGA